MMVKSFLAWMDNASSQDRAEAVDILAQAYLHSTLGGERPEDVEAALTTVLDDPSPQVRRTLAIAIADARNAPRHIVLALAADEPEVSALLVARSPLLMEADLLDLALVGEGLVLSAIALRAEVTPRIAHALIMREKLDLSLTLLRNRRADIDEADLVTLVNRHGHDKAVRDAVLARDDAPIIVRHMVMMLISRQLGDYVSGAGFISKARNTRLLEETILNVTLTLADRAGEDMARFVAYLRQTAQLTPGLLLRSLLTGKPYLLFTALAELADLDIGRVQSVMRSRSDATLYALLKRAGMPNFLMAPLIAATRALDAVHIQPAQDIGWFLPAIRAALNACVTETGEDSVRLVALLRRYEMEASRLLSRHHAHGLREHARMDFARMAEDQKIELAAYQLEDVQNEAEPTLSEMIGYEEPIELSVPEAAPAPVQDEPVPDLRSIIEEWRREREAKDALRTPEQPKEAPEPTGTGLHLRLVA